MHDPMAVAFEIRSPIRQKPSEMWPKGYRDALVTIWHCDPERGGSDDSCGYTFPRLTDAQLERLKGAAWSEAYAPHFQALRAKKNEDLIQAECLMRGAVQRVADALDVRVSWGEVCGWACRFIHSSDGGFRGSLCFLPGWHSNFDEDRQHDREDHALSLFIGVARHILRDRRPWWRHPKWHLHHWRVQVHPYQAFLRWAFTRCRRCGGRFGWGETGVGTWGGRGPGWFRSETLTHMGCDRAAVPCQEPAR